VWVAVSGLPGRAGLALGTAVAAGASIAGAAAGASASEIAAALLLYALLGLMAHYMAQARDSQERTELLLAELQDARDEQARAAALAERARIAGELHDVLAHSLSGAAIQLQGARKLAERDGVGDETAAAIARAVELVRGGLDDARRAVGALRGGERPSLERFEALVAGVGDDLGVEATARVEGVARPLPADAAHALRRAVQEALTNAARHAPGARAEVVLAYGAQDVTLTVEDRGRAGALALAAPALADAGGGRGLAGMRERAERAGGSLRAGPTREGWRVELRVPA
jgi:signal transduction histidine kinase